MARIMPDSLTSINTSGTFRLLTFRTKELKMSTYPRTFSHIGISVPDVEKAANFYSEVMGWYHIMEPTVINAYQRILPWRKTLQDVLR